jgi:hypothetical protein
MPVLGCCNRFAQLLGHRHHLAVDLDLGVEVTVDAAAEQGKGEPHKAVGLEEEVVAAVVEEEARAFNVERLDTPSATVLHLVRLVHHADYICR